MLLFANLGGADLFEPDEGRNAEKAREILLLNDWVTPHENFLPVLDKPISYYWLVAFSFKLFGVSEWSARLPSALAALGCLWLVFRFADRHWGRWVALWSVLILLTSVEFFLLARLVIIEMSLTLFVSLALCCFYSAVHCEDEKTRKKRCLVFYVALSAATLTKGLVGLIIAGIVCSAYLLLARKWRLLGKLYLLRGMVVYLALVLPWYLWAENRNPGYLSYYIWDEHFVRYLTDEFNRSKQWYYFLAVAAVGFAPWTVILPFVLRRLRPKADDGDLFLLLWAVLPLLFFSASNSQLPHYILPIFLPLAILTGRTLVAANQPGGKEQNWPFYLPWIAVAGTSLYTAARAFRPDLFFGTTPPAIAQNAFAFVFGAASVVLLYGSLALANAKGYGRDQRGMYISSAAGMVIFFLMVALLMSAASRNRSAKMLAETSAPYITAESQVAIFSNYVTGLLFYLKLERPIWIAAERGKSISLGSPYVARFQPPPAPGRGKVFFTYEEFRNAWERAERPVRLFLKAKNVAQLNDAVGITTKELLRADDYVLVTKP